MSKFNFEDIFQFESLLKEDDRMIMETAREYAQTKLEPRAMRGNQEGPVGLQQAVRPAQRIAQLQQPGPLALQPGVGAIGLRQLLKPGGSAIPVRMRQAFVPIDTFQQVQRLAAGANHRVGDGLPRRYGRGWGGGATEDATQQIQQGSHSTPGA